MPGLIGAGYAAARPFRPAPPIHGARLPPALLTASSCLAAVGPGPWALSWTTGSAERRRDSARELGVDPAALPLLERWLQARMDAGEWTWPRWFTALATAREFVARFCARDPATAVIGIGVTEATVRELGLPIVPDERPLAPGGRALGYELLGAEMGGDFHSWLCNDLEPVLHERLALRVNAHGLIDDLDTAAAAARELMDPEVGAEPVPWFPALLVDYTAP